MKLFCWSNRWRLWLVAPLAGAWIEIYAHKKGCRENIVAPLAGAWIEIEEGFINEYKNLVAPLAGAWIEISVVISPSLTALSLLSRERGLKFDAIAVGIVSGMGRSSRGSVD